MVCCPDQPAPHGDRDVIWSNMVPIVCVKQEASSATEFGNRSVGRSYSSSAADKSGDDVQMCIGEKGSGTSDFRVT